jgi:hypothetical protein
MSEQSPKTTLGYLQGDQSEIQLSKSLSFIVSKGNQRSTEFHVAVHNYDVLYIKGEYRIALQAGRVPCGCELKMSIKMCPN